MLPGLTLDAMAEHRTAWADLAGRALEPSIFSDPAFLGPAIRHLSGWRQPRFLLAWDADEPARLIGLCCVAPGWTCRAWLHAQATAAFPLLDAAVAARALADLLAQTRGWRPAGLVMSGLPADGPTQRLIEGEPRWSLARLDARSRAVVRRPPPPLGGKAGKEFRRQARRLAQEGEVAVTASDTPDAFDGFLSLEARGWKGRRATALAAQPSRAHFARDMAAALAPDGRCRTYGMTLDGRMIAAGLVLRSGPHAFFWKTAYDEAFARFSPGAHLAAAIGDLQARESGLHLTDSCAVPNHSMIDRLWPERMVVFDALLVPAPALSALQHVILGVERARRAARAWVKRTRLRYASGRRHNPNMARP